MTPRIHRRITAPNPLPSLRPSNRATKLQPRVISYSMRSKLLPPALLAALLFSSASCQDKLASEYQPECLDEPAELLEGLDATLPSGEKVSDLITLSWDAVDRRVTQVGRRNPGSFSYEPDSNGKRASIFVEREAGRIEYIRSKPNPFFGEELQAVCPHRLKVEVKLRFESDDGAFDEELTGEVVREFDPESKKEGSIYLTASLPFNEINGSFEIELPEMLSEKQEESAEIRLFSHEESAPTLSVRWKAKAEKERPPELHRFVERDIYKLL